MRPTLYGALEAACAFCGGDDNIPAAVVRFLGWWGQSADGSRLAAACFEWLDTLSDDGGILVALADAVDDVNSVLYYHLAPDAADPDAYQRASQQVEALMALDGGMAVDAGGHDDVCGGTCRYGPGPSVWYAAMGMRRATKSTEPEVLLGAGPICVPAPTVAEPYLLRPWCQSERASASWSKPIGPQGTTAGLCRVKHLGRCEHEPPRRSSAPAGCRFGKRCLLSWQMSHDALGDARIVS